MAGSQERSRTHHYLGNFPLQHHRSQRYVLSAESLSQPASGAPRNELVADSPEPGMLAEFRFVLPLLPPALVYAGYCIRNLENKLYVQLRERTQRNLLRLAVFTIVVPNAAAAYYLSRWHQVTLSDAFNGSSRVCNSFPLVD